MRIRFASMSDLGGELHSHNVDQTIRYNISNAYVCPSHESIMKRVKMTTVSVQEKFIEILTSFGDLQESVNADLQRYTIDQITTKINELRHRDEEYKIRYGVDYSIFSKRIGEDQEFVQNIESNISKVWEVDLADWEFCHKGMEDWTKKLQDILLK